MKVGEDEERERWGRVDAFDNNELYAPLFWRTWRWSSEESSERSRRTGREAANLSFAFLPRPRHSIMHHAFGSTVCKDRRVTIT